LSASRLQLIVCAAVCTACAPAPEPAATNPADPAHEKWYSETIDELNAMNREAERAFHAGKADNAAALIIKGQPLANRLVAVSHPTLSAVEAASDLDQLYGQMLLSNGNYGWARLEFQKNRARWKSWHPQSEEAARRLQQAEAAIAECDRRMTQ
jgi:hypothetical protein